MRWSYRQRGRYRIYGGHVLCTQKSMVNWLLLIYLFINWFFDFPKIVLWGRIALIEGLCSEMARRIWQIWHFKQSLLDQRTILLFKVKSQGDTLRWKQFVWISLCWSIQGWSVSRGDCQGTAATFMHYEIAVWNCLRIVLRGFCAKNVQSLSYRLILD